MVRFMVALAGALATASSLSLDVVTPGDCRNRTWGEVTPMSWHIHYTTNSTDAPRFYAAFVGRFRKYFPPADQGDKCPFGPNYGSNAYKYVCSLESAVFDTRLIAAAPVGGDPWTVPQRAFFIPLEVKEEAWAWAKKNGGGSDVLLHPNTGCMHDDHSLRAQWVVSKARSVAPVIEVLEFPCNIPLTGCNDTKFSGPPRCGCTTPLKSDAPSDSCKNCIMQFIPPQVHLNDIPAKMKAAVASAPAAPEGNFSNVGVKQIDVPTPGIGQVLIKVIGSSVNPVDWKILMPSTGLGLKFPHTLGFDVSGTIVKVGTGVDRLRVGDDVWADLGKTWILRGGELGAYAEYAVADASQVGKKPAHLSFAQAGIAPLVGLTALQAFRKTGAPNSAPWTSTNLTVLITSGSGGTGHVAIQIAKAYGAKNIIAAGGPESLDLMKQWGATTVVDYHKESVFDAAGGNDTVDVVFDNHGAPGTADKAMPVIRAGGVFIFLPGLGGSLSKHPKEGVTQINYGLTDSSHYSDLDELAAIPNLSPYVFDSFPLEKAVDALERNFKGGVNGKVAISMK